MPDVLLSEDRGALRILTLNRQERRNALDAALAAALQGALQQAESDPAVRAVLLTGAGGTFCVGGDVKAMDAGEGATVPEAERIAALRDRMEAARLLHEMRKPTVAAIEGAAAGAGLALALACDFRVCGQGSKLTTAFVKVGLSGDYGGSYFLSRVVGPARARELYMLSPIMTGAEALAIGMVTRAVPDDAVMAEALALAEGLAAGPTLTLGHMKETLAMAAGGATLDACLTAEARNHIESSATADHREAARAFMEKRRPAFRGA